MPPQPSEVSPSLGTITAGIGALRLRPASDHAAFRRLLLSWLPDGDLTPGPSP